MFSRLKRMLVVAIVDAFRTARATAPVSASIDGAFGPTGRPGALREALAVAQSREDDESRGGCRDDAAHGASRIRLAFLRGRPIEVGAANARADAAERRSFEMEENAALRVAEAEELADAAQDAAVEASTRARMEASLRAELERELAAARGDTAHRAPPSPASTTPSSRPRPRTWTSP